MVIEVNVCFLYFSNVIFYFYVFKIASQPVSRATGIANSIIFMQHIGMVMQKIIINDGEETAKMSLNKPR